MMPRKDEPNIYPGVLGMAQAVIVTADSVNMASEAAITGKPVMIAPWLDAGPENPSGETGRIRAFHDAMFAARHTAALTPAAVTPATRCRAVRPTSAPSNVSTRWISEKSSGNE